MAIRGQEIELVQGGTDLTGAVRGPYVQNMLWRHGAWRVRKGFGTLTQRGTTLGELIGDVSVLTGCTNANVWGYTKHLGSYLLHTDFGHDQILSVYLGRAYVEESRIKDEFRPLFFVTIYDVTTNDWWEEVLHARTSDYDERVRELPEQHGVYATNRENDFQRWLVGDRDITVSFTEVGDLVVFGNRQMGLWQYRPAFFSSDRRRDRIADRTRQLNSFHTRASSPGYEEASVVTRLNASDGTNVPGVVYLKDSELPQPEALATLALEGNPVLVLASGRTVLFAEQGFPGSFPAETFLGVPSEREISAIAEHNGQLFIWTEDETWLYQPNLDSFLVNSGRLIRLSETVGCVGPSAWTQSDGRLIWVDRNGVWSNAQGLGIEKISGPIDPYFQEQTTNPLTSFYTEAGYSGRSNVNPASTKQFCRRGVNVVWSPELRALLVSVPDDSGTILCLTDAGWSFWTVESMADNDGASDSEVGTQRNLRDSWLLADEERVYLVGGPEQQFVIDSQAGNEFNHCNSSFYILEYGRGGGLDRNVEQEDDRRFIGRYDFDDLNPLANAYVQIGKPIYLGPNYSIPGVTGTVNENYFILPIYLAPRSAGTPLAINEVEFRFTVDTIRFRPVELDVGGDNLAAVLWPERQGSILGWNIGAGDASAEVRKSGSEIRLHWNSSVAPAGSWTHYPVMNVIPGRPNPLIGLLFEFVGSGAYHSMLIDPTFFELNGLVVADEPAFWWDEPVPGTSTRRRTEDALAQPVDWAYASAQFLVEEGIQAKVRGYHARVLSRGMGTNKQVEPWLYGLFNSVLSTDWRGWSSQVIDHDPAVDDVVGVNDLRSVGTIRFRVKDTGSMKMAIFDNGLVYGDAGSPVNNAEDNVLIGDEEVSVVSTSESVRGGHFRYLFFGFVQNKAEALTLESVRAVVRAMSTNRRRIAHPTKVAGG